MRLISIFLAGLTTLLPARAAVEFDGTDDYVTTSQKLGLSTSPFSASFWIKTTTAIANRPIVGELHNTLASWNVRFANITTGTLNFLIFDGTSTDTATTSGATKVNDGNWHHVAVFRNGSVLDVFIDGASQVSSPPTDNARNVGANANFAMMARSDSFLPNGGILSDVQIYNRALSAAEIAILGSSRTKGPKFSGLIHYWPLDGVADGASGDAATFKDRAGTANGTGNDGANNTGLTGRAETYLSYP